MGAFNWTWKVPLALHLSYTNMLILIKAWKPETKCYRNVWHSHKLKCLWMPSSRFVFKLKYCLEYDECAPRLEVDHGILVSLCHSMYYPWKSHRRYLSRSANQKRKNKCNTQQPQLPQALPPEHTMYVENSGSGRLPSQTLFSGIWLGRKLPGVCLPRLC